MKKFIIIFWLAASVNAIGQQNFFKPYTDSIKLVEDANIIVSDFTSRVNAIEFVMANQPRSIMNTRPFLIFYSPKSNVVNLPLWEQVMPAQKDFFYKLAGDSVEGRELFGLFFNGFYLPHELGHALQNFAKRNKFNLYEGEYFANVVAILYWRKMNRITELEQCYNYAKQIVGKLPDPVPEGEDPENYFNEHYAELGADPSKYGYFQFAQFVKIYEDKSLPGFDEFVKKYLEREDVLR